MPFIILGFAVLGIVLFVSETMVTSFGVAKPHKKHRHKKIKKTAISNKFKGIYNYIETEYASELEENRKKLIKSIIICFILFVIGFLLYILLKERLDLNTSRSRRILGIPFIPAVIYYIYKYKKYNGLYVENYKNKIIKNFLEYINHNLNYHQYGGKGLLNYYLDAKFEDNEFNSFVTDDYIEGYNENSTNIEMCNFALENVNDKGEFLNMAYEGIFSVTQLNSFLTDEIRIKKNRYTLKNNYNKIEMDSKDFEKYFDVYCNSNILAMEILTHDIMEELVQFYDTYRIEFEIIIKNNHIYIRFNTGVMFEPNILKKSNDMNTLWVYYNVLKFVTNVTVKINKLLKDLEV